VRNAGNGDCEGKQEEFIPIGNFPLIRNKQEEFIPIGNFIQIRNKPRRRKTMSKQDEQDFGAAVTLICALVLAFLFMCCVIKTVLDKLHRPAVKASEEVTTTEETE